MKNWLLPSLVAMLLSLTACAAQQTRQSPPAAAQASPGQARYCPVNLWDVRDVRPCFDSQAACQQSIIKSSKYVCNPESALKYPPRQP